MSSKSCRVYKEALRLEHQSRRRLRRRQFLQGAGETGPPAEFGTASFAMPKVLIHPPLFGGVEHARSRQR
jgi:hypothetical protein